MIKPFTRRKLYGGKVLEVDKNDKDWDKIDLIRLYSKEKQIESCLFQRVICSYEFYFHYLCLNVFTKEIMIWILK